MEQEADWTISHRARATYFSDALEQHSFVQVVESLSLLGVILEIQPLELVRIAVRKECSWTVGASYAHS
jgi:hypothetical protein